MDNFDEEILTDYQLNIDEELFDKEVTLGSTVKFTCKVNIPNIEAYWLKDGDMLQSDSHWAITTKGYFHTLTINNVSFDDEANYTCVIQNKSTEAYMLLVEEPEIGSMDDDSDIDGKGEDAIPSKRKLGRNSALQHEHDDSDFEDNLAPQQQRRHRILPVDMLLATLCCTTMLCLASLCEADILRARESYQTMSNHEQKQWLLDFFWSHSIFCEDEMNWKFLYVIGTKTVCCVAFQLILGIPSSSFYAIRKKFFNQEKVILTKSSRYGRRSVQSMAVIAFLQEYANKYAEKLPDSKKFHLPSCCTKTSIYEEMKADLIPNNLMISFSHFMKLWRKEMHHIAIPKNSRFSKCNICTSIKISIAKTRNTKELEMLKARRDCHLKKQSAERQKYYKHQTKARSYPSKYLSVIIDGMDQSKTYVPHFVHISKYTSSMWKLKMHLIGVIVHGIGIYGFFDMFQWSHSSNLTITILMEVFLMLKDSLPKVLYLQMDNCYRENKNRYMLAFLSLLVEKKIFQKVKVSFLMVGHTHEDIDQVFSRLSIWLSKHAALTVDNLMDSFEKCYHPTPTSIKTSRVFNVTEWMNEYIEPLKGQSKPHVFKIVLGEAGRAEMYWKKWSTDKSWNKCDGYIIKSNPMGIPSLLSPNFDDIEVEKLEADIRNSFQFFNSDDDKTWWIKFFSDFDKDLDYVDAEWPLEILKRSTSISEEIQSIEEELPTSVFEFVDEDTCIPPVLIGKQSKLKLCTKPIHLDDMVLLDIPKYAGEWPQLGQVVEMLESKIKIKWYKGSMSGSWSPCTIRATGERGKRKVWTEDVSPAQIWCWGFNLTPSGYLPKRIKEKVEEYDTY